MTSARLNDIQLTPVVILGVFLVVANLAELLHLLPGAASAPARGYHLLLGSTSTILAALLTFTLFFLSRSLARTARQQRAISRLLADRTQEQEEWRRTFDTMTDFVSVHDGNFKIVKANKALCEFLDKRPEDIIGRYCYQVFHDRTTPIDGCPHAKAKDIGQPVAMEVHDLHLGLPLLITCSPFADEQGHFAGSVHIARIQPSVNAGCKIDPAHFIPICASCKDIRDEGGNWVKIEDYVHLRFKGVLTHSICKTCQKKIYPQLFQG
ncbi:MAG: PAS domain-containing protein [Desulfobulbaceae bacterium]